MLVPPSNSSASRDRAQGAKSSGWASARLWFSPLPSTTGAPKLATIWLTARPAAVMPAAPAAPLMPAALALSAVASDVASAARLVPVVVKLTVVVSTLPVVPTT